MRIIIAVANVLSLWQAAQRRLSLTVEEVVLPLVQPGLSVAFRRAHNCRDTGLLELPKT
jgi:hypothetical protein